MLHHIDCYNMAINDILNNDDFIFMQQDIYSEETGDKYQQILSNYILSISFNCNYKI